MQQSMVMAVDIMAVVVVTVTAEVMEVLVEGLEE
jgi:hypothetical protein